MPALKPRQLSTLLTLSPACGSKHPLVSVVTPFYNTEQYLAECIESVLAQTYLHFEYILVDNCSTDKSRAIAEEYARKDPRVRLVHNDVHLGQVQNYNRALGEIGPSKYCKLVQADDWIFPECLERMVQVAEANPSVGLVSSYQLWGNAVHGNGLFHNQHILSGRDVCRMQLLKGFFLFGSPTALLVRSEIVRTRHPFYSQVSLHEDTDACYEILQAWDFAFVHNVLSYIRIDNKSISSAVRDYNPDLLDWYIQRRKYGPIFLSVEEYNDTLRWTERNYFRYLAQSVFERRGREFWEYHRKGLATIGVRLSLTRLWKHVCWELIDILCNPKKTTGRIVNFVRLRVQKRYGTKSFCRLLIRQSRIFSSEGQS
jgi:glycosyltransferase involved in cell wall biosynthesis